MRGIGYPFSKKHIFVKKDSFFKSKEAILILKYNNLKSAKKQIEKINRLLRNPLIAEIYYPPKNNSKAYPLVFLQGGEN
jgi:hypothetical protein